MIVKDYEIISNIKVFHSDIDENYEDYNEKHLSSLYAEEEKHFWFLARKNFILEKMKKYVGTKSKIIELGAGTGNVSRFLIENGYLKLSVGEIHLNGLRYAISYGIKDCYQFDLLRTPFKDEFDAVCMFDVLEHIENDSLALQNINAMLKKNGYIIISVPAHMWLWNREDRIAGHKRRYTKKSLHDLLIKNNFEIIEEKYFFIFITPLLFLRKILNPDRNEVLEASELNINLSINKYINRILFYINKLEAKLSKFLPNIFGGSIFVIARKRNDII